MAPLRFLDTTVGNIERVLLFCSGIMWNTSHSCTLEFDGNSGLLLGIKEKNYGGCSK